MKITSSSLKASKKVEEENYSALKNCQLKIDYYQKVVISLDYFKWFFPCEDFWRSDKRKRTFTTISGFGKLRRNGLN